MNDAKMFVAYDVNSRLEWGYNWRFHFSQNTLKTIELSFRLAPTLSITLLQEKSFNKSILDKLE